MTVNGVPLEVGLDTGSIGLRLLPSAVQDEHLQRRRTRQLGQHPHRPVRQAELAADRLEDHRHDIKLGL